MKLETLLINPLIVGIGLSMCTLCTLFPFILKNGIGKKRVLYSKYRKHTPKAYKVYTFTLAGGGLANVTR